MKQRATLLVLPLFLLVLGAATLAPKAAAQTALRTVNVRSSVSINGIQYVHTLVATSGTPSVRWYSVAPSRYDVPMYGNTAWNSLYQRAVWQRLAARQARPPAVQPIIVPQPSSSSSSSSLSSSSLAPQSSARSEVESSSSTPASVASTPSSVPVVSSSARSDVAPSSLITDRREVLRIVNEERAKAGLPSYTYNTTLEQSAQTYTEHMQSTNCFSHTCDSTLKERMHASGYYQPDTGKSYSYGENIAVGQTSPEQVMRDWMNSPSHRSAILNTIFHEIGIGRSGNYWALHFGLVQWTEDSYESEETEESDEILDSLVSSVSSVSLAAESPTDE